MEQSAPQETRAWPPRRVALATLTVLLVAGAFWILFDFRLVFFSLFVAVVLSTAIEPLIALLGRLRISRTLAVVLITLLMLLAVVALIMTVAPLVIEQWTTITSIVTGWYADARVALMNSDSLLVRRLGRQLPIALPLMQPAPPAAGATNEDTLDLVAQAFATAAMLFRGLFILVGVFLLTSLWAIEGDRTIRWLLMAVSPQRREKVRDFIQELYRKVGAYTRGLFILCSIIGVMQFIAYLIIGLPNALLLGILAGIMEIVPIVGPLLGAIPAIVVAAAFDPSKLVWVIAATVLIQMLENNLVAPRVMDKAVGVNPVASLLAFVAFGTIFGFVGALLAIPLAALIQLILNRVLFKTETPENVSVSGRSSISILRYEAQDLAQDIRKQVREKDAELNEHADRVEDEMEAVILDLDSILASVETQEGEANGNGQTVAGGPSQ